MSRSGWRAAAKAGPHRSRPSVGRLVDFYGGDREGEEKRDVDREEHQHEGEHDRRAATGVVEDRDDLEQPGDHDLEL